ncbi:MBL fold metallo-hydrolase [Hydrogenophaga sp. D2P1]|uniref:MBL fold metallo-hydrolase n=1 Tax=Hydrogenophaga aromaticivorans TaxID=2610898 RepID=A0A7Y8GXE6_9BURK|nr:MBL fold metallo-hydrolase [Hydrogenophaga aromaticivorans]NWF46597.1 MBL fold metallo-hydrolase [Hydrogenophaga aromaticivorans]
MPLRLLRRHLLGLSLCALVPLAHAVDIKFEPVAPGVYAFVGEKGGRTHQNEGLNANIGLVVTPAGALLVDSGASFQGAKQIHDAVKKVTTQQVKWVINTGGQDHRWLGNGYFITQGVEVIAHADAKADMLARGGDHIASLKNELKEKLDGTVPALPTRWLSSQDETLNLGGMAIEVKHRKGGHTPGDLMVWLPQQRVVFSGDIVYVDRLLGVLPFSHTGRWLDSFTVLEALQPARIVPGHGDVCDLPKAQAQTRDYLRALRTHMKKAVDDGTEISTAIKAFDAQPWMGLLNAAELHPGNASRTYLELERE